MLHSLSLLLFRGTNLPFHHSHTMVEWDHNNYQSVSGYYMGNSFLFAALSQVFECCLYPMPF